MPAYKKMKNRRTSERIFLQVHGGYLEESNKSWKDCLVMDVSSKGLGILLKEKIKLSSQLLLEIETGQATIKAYGNVRWVKPMQGNESFKFAVGIKITDTNDRGLNALISFARSQLYMSEEHWEHLIENIY